MRTYEEKKLVYDIVSGGCYRITDISMISYTIVEGRLSSYENFNNRNVKTRMRNYI